MTDSRGDIKLLYLFICNNSMIVITVCTIYSYYNVLMIAIVTICNKLNIKNNITLKIYGEDKYIGNIHIVHGRESSR